MPGLSPLSLIVRTLFVGSLLALLAAGPAAATWSVVAADAETGEVGVAFASCVPGEVLGRLEEPLVPVVLVPGVAAGIAQGQFNAGAPARIRELVAAGADSADIVADLSAEDFDELATVRQYGVVRLPGSVAAFTGTDNGAEAADRQGDLVTVQGNLLISNAVVDDTKAAFEQARERGGSLADALVEALSAGSTAGGDRRCDQQTALFAQLVVAAAGDSPTEPSIVLTVTVDAGDGQNPVVLLAAAHQQGRRGVVAAGTSDDGTGLLFPIVALSTAVLMIVVGGIALARGIGSVRARR